MVMGIVFEEETTHLGNVLIPNGDLLIDQIVVGLIENLYELSATHVEHADGRTLWGIAPETDLKALGSLEGSQRITAHVFATIVGIPARTVLLVVASQFLVDIDLVAINEHIQCERHGVVSIEAVLRSVLVLSLELKDAPKATVADGSHQTHALDLHAVLLFQLCNDSLRQWFGLVPLRLIIDDRQILARLQVAVGDDHRTPLIGTVFARFLLLGISIVETGTKRRYLRTVALTDAGCVAVGILEHFIDEFDLDELTVHKHVGIFRLVATEHLLQRPALVLRLEIVSVVFRLLRFFEIRPVEHVGILVTAHEEHRHRCGVVLLDNTIDDGRHGVLRRSRLSFTLVLASNHHGHHTDGPNT